MKKMENKKNFSTSIFIFTRNQVIVFFNFSKNLCGWFINLYTHVRMRRSRSAQSRLAREVADFNVRGGVEQQFYNIFDDAASIIDNQRRSLRLFIGGRARAAMAPLNRRHRRRPGPPVRADNDEPVEAAEEEPMEAAADDDNDYVVGDNYYSSDEEAPGPAVVPRQPAAPIEHPAVGVRRSRRLLGEEPEFKIQLIDVAPRRRRRRIEPPPPAANGYPPYCENNTVNGEMPYAPNFMNNDVYHRVANGNGADQSIYLRNKAARTPMFGIHNAMEERTRFVALTTNVNTMAQIRIYGRQWLRNERSAIYSRSVRRIRGVYIYENHAAYMTTVYSHAIALVICTAFQKFIQVNGFDDHIYHCGVMLSGSRLLVLNEAGRDLFRGPYEANIESNMLHIMTLENNDDASPSNFVLMLNNIQLNSTTNRIDFQNAIRDSYYNLANYINGELNAVNNQLNAEGLAGDLDSNTYGDARMVLRQGLAESAGIDWINPGRRTNWSILFVRGAYNINAGCGANADETDENLLSRAKGIVRVPPTDKKMCVPMAIFAGKIAKANSRFNFTNNLVGWINQTYAVIQKNKWEGYLGNKWDLRMANEFAMQLGYRLLVFNGDNNNFRKNVFYYTTPFQRSNTIHDTIAIVYRNEHASLVTSVTAYLKEKAYCFSCLSPHSGTHICPLLHCGLCMSSHFHDPEQEEQKICEECDGIFFLDCYHAHKTNRVCSQIFYCFNLSCWSKGSPIYTKKQSKHQHTCARRESKCRFCKEIIPEEGEHVCYMQKLEPKPHSTKLIAFDFETFNNEVVLSIAKYLYSDKDMVYHDTAKDFLDWVLTDEHDGYIFFAHNGRGFDFHFVLAEAVRREECTPKVTFNGTKMVSFSVTYPVVNRLSENLRKKKKNSVQFIDSLAFFLQPLSNLPATFNIEETQKGFFAHWLPEEKWGSTDLPAIEYYRPDIMSLSRYNEFMEWYQKEIEKSTPYNHHQMLVKYCESDVLILAKSLELFRDACIKDENFDPYSNCKTIASLSLGIFMANYMERDKLALLNDKQEEFVRAAFMGGKTGCHWFKYEFKEGEYGSYYDVVSLYPYINSVCEYPIGPGRFVYSYNHPDLDRIPFELKGIFDVTVSSPADIIHPILPHVDKESKGLLFSRHERFRYKWTHIELALAIRYGYHILEFHQALVWDNWEASPFGPYIRSAIAKKQQYRGYPDNCRSEEEKKEYVERFRREGIEMKEIVKNPGASFFNKILANSLWGKLCQRRFHQESVFCKTSEMFKYVDNNKKKIKEFELLGDNLEKTYLLTDYINPIDDPKRSKKILPTIGVFTCAYGRARISEVQQLLGKRMLYWDTDSIIFINNDGFQLPFPTGDCVGQFKNELKQGQRITRWMCIAPKFYAYEVDSDKIQKKCKGIKLTHAANNLISFESMEAILNREQLVFHESNLVCKSKLEVPKPVENDKVIRFVNNKGITRVDEFGNIYCEPVTV